MLTRIINGREFKASKTFSDSDQNWSVTSRPINQKTGKAWQARKQEAIFEGERAKCKALWFLCKLA